MVKPKQTKRERIRAWAKKRTMMEQAALVAEAEWRRCRAEPQYFITEYVRIEDRDAPEVAIPFTLWSAQTRVLETMLGSRLVVVLKARQLGLTWLALAYAVWHMLFQPGYTVVALSKREDPDAKELVRRVEFILRYLPRWMARHVRDQAKGFVGPLWDATTLRATIQHPNGEASTFTSMSAAPDSGRSFTASLVILDEWAFQPWAREIWSAAYPTVNRPTGGQVIGISTGRRGTLFEEVWQGAESGANGFKPVFLPWHADPRRTHEWYEQTKLDLPHSYQQEYPGSPQDAFTAGEGAAFPEWDEQVHVPFDATWYPPDGWKIVRAYDGGYMTRACCKWYAISPDGWAVCYREYYPHMVTDAEQAREIVRLSKKLDGSMEDVAHTIADPSCWQKRSGTGESTAEVFARHGVPLVQADNDRINGWKRLHEWLKPFPGPDGKMMARLRFTRACANTIRTYPGVLVDKNRPEDVDTDCEEHPQDCDRYFCMSRPRPAPEAKPELSGVYSYGELKMLGYSDAKIRRLRNKVKIIGWKGGR